MADWFYAPGFNYDPGMMIRYAIEAIAKDFNVAICISILPEGSLMMDTISFCRQIKFSSCKAAWLRRLYSIIGTGKIIKLL